MTDQQTKELLFRYTQNLCSPEEQAIIETWYLSQADAALQTSFEDMATDVDEIEKHLLKRIKPKRAKLWPRNAAAAAILIILAGGVIFINRINKHEFDNRNKFVNDIQPGSNKAYLTLSDGSKISLNDSTASTLTKEQGVAVIKNQDGSIRYQIEGRTPELAGDNTVSTPNGGQYKIELVDGTKIWLNAGTSLTYPSSFSKTKNRVVKLSGEAYFEVAKDPGHPFIVETGNQLVTVLGTHFDINAYTDEPAIRTTLIEGLVRIEGKAENKPGQLIYPGQVASFGKKGVTVNAANIEEALAWKNGYFRFEDESIQSVMRKLARWYDIEVSYQGNISASGFNGKLSRFNNISQILNALESTKTLHFKVEGRRVTVIQ